MPKLSVVIPSWKDPLLQKTVDSLLENSELGEGLEIVVVLDGYWPDPPLVFSEDRNRRVIQLHLGKNRGMREAINAGVRAARGEFIMRTDEHCVFGPGYDRILTERFKDDWIMYPKRFYLDPVKWVNGEDPVMDKEPNVYNKLIIDPKRRKFAGVNWKSREIGREHKVIDESMAMQGSCWICKRKLWDSVIGELQTEGWGPHYSDSHEMVFKLWRAGGRLMVHKGTWHAHKHRDFPRTHNFGEKEARPGWDYGIKTWGKYYEEVVRPRWGI